MKNDIIAGFEITTRVIPETRARESRGLESGQLHCREFVKYVEGLGPTDAVVLEASTGAFFWADQIEAKGARCFVVDPRKFRIIKDSWNKTDKQDARNLAKALWVHVVTGEFGIPTVCKPTGVVRELRKLFAQYCLLNRQIATHKNNAQAILVKNGVELKKELKSRLFAPESGLELLKEMNVSPASRVCLELTLHVLWKVEEAKERLATEILLAGEPLRSQVELLISIKGVTPLIALAFLADVADIRRFRTLRKMNACIWGSCRGRATVEARVGLATLLASPGS